MNYAFSFYSVVVATTKEFVGSNLPISLCQANQG